MHLLEGVHFRFAVLVLEHSDHMIFKRDGDSPFMPTAQIFAFDLTMSLHEVCRDTVAVVLGVLNHLGYRLNRMLLCY